MPSDTESDLEDGRNPTTDSERADSEREGPDDAANGLDTPRAVARHAGNNAATRRRLIHIQRPDAATFVAILLLTVGFVFVIGAGLVGITGSDRYRLPATVEEVSPLPDSVQVPVQTSVKVDLATGYTGVLVIDGIELPTVNLADISSRAKPGVQVNMPPATIYEAGNATLTFTPSDDAPITSFASGRHDVQVIYWAPEQGRGRSRTFAWSFNVL